MSKSWIGQFKPKGVVCHDFWRLRNLAPCIHGCEFCYLPSTYSRFGFPSPITETDLPAMEAAVEKWMDKRDCPVCFGSGKLASLTETKMLSDVYCHSCFGTGRSTKLLNAGELSDSFAPDICAKASLRLIELFRKQDRHTLLLVTKSNRIAEILKDMEPTERVILSFSVGQDMYNHRPIGPNMYEILVSAKWARAHRWRVRLRIDPIIYQDFGIDIQRMEAYGNSGTYERITLGTLRATAAHYRYLRNGNEVQRALAALLTRQSDGGSHPYRLPFEQRVAIYQQALSDLAGLSSSIGICKETPAIFAALGLKPEDNRCNCMI